MKQIRYAIAALFIALSTSLVAMPALASADFKGDACAGISTVQGGSCSATSGAKIFNIIRLAVNILSIIVGFAAVIMIMVAGFKYITSGGDSSSIASAKSTLTYALVGLVIVALSQVIVKFVLHNAK